MTPEEIEALLGAYALGAVDEEERAIVDAYVAQHPEAASELEQLQDASVWLAVSGAPAAPDLWDKISAVTLPEPIPLRVPDRKRASHRNQWIVAVAAALAFVIAVGISVVATRDDKAPSTSELAAVIADAQFSSSARRIQLQSPTNNASAEAVILRDGTGFLVSADLPKLGATRTYQLWAVNGDSTVSLGVLGPNLGPSAFKFVGDPDALAITEEVAGGVAQSSNSPVVAGRVPSV